MRNETINVKPTRPRLRSERVPEKLDYLTQCKMSLLPVAHKSCNSKDRKVICCLLKCLHFLRFPNLIGYLQSCMNFSTKYIYIIRLSWRGFLSSCFKKRYIQCLCPPNFSVWCGFIRVSWRKYFQINYPSTFHLGWTVMWKKITE